MLNDDELSAGVCFRWKITLISVLKLRRVCCSPVAQLSLASSHHVK